MIPEPEELPNQNSAAGDADDATQEPESKSQRKRNAHQITDLAAQLVEMKPKARASLPIDENIRDAIAHCAEIRAHGAKKRQLHFVSKLLRESENIQQLLTLVLRPELTKKPGSNPHLEFRDQLLANFGDSVDALREKYPTVELQQVRQLVRNAQTEYEKSQSRLDANGEPEVQLSVNNTRASKALLKLLTKGG